MNKLFINGFDLSPITGPEGNIEYLIYGTKHLDYSLLSEENREMHINTIKELVSNAHRQLYRKWYNEKNTCYT